jgi:hypothetical protein
MCAKFRARHCTRLWNNVEDLKQLKKIVAGKLNVNYNLVINHALNFGRADDEFSALKTRTLCIQGVWGIR